MEDQLALTSSAEKGVHEDRANRAVGTSVHASARPREALPYLRRELVALLSELSAAVLLNTKGKK